MHRFPLNKGRASIGQSSNASEVSERSCFLAQTGRQLIVCLVFFAAGLYSLGPEDFPSEGNRYMIFKSTRDIAHGD